MVHLEILVHAFHDNRNIGFCLQLGFRTWNGHTSKVGSPTLFIDKTTTDGVPNTICEPYPSVWWIPVTTEIMILQ